MTVTWPGAGKRTERGQGGHGVLFNEQPWYNGTWCAVRRAREVHGIRYIVYERTWEVLHTSAGTLEEGNTSQSKGPMGRVHCIYARIATYVNHPCGHGMQSKESHQTLAFIMKRKILHLFAAKRARKVQHAKVGAPRGNACFNCHTC